MRIGMMADMYKPHISGVTNHIALTKGHLEEAGHEVFVFTFGDKDYVDDEPNIIRSPGLPLAYHYGDKDFRFGIRYNKDARRMVKTMDIVHVHHPFLSGTLALRYCRPRGTPIVFTNHTRFDIYMQTLIPQIPESVGKAFLETYMPTFTNACDLVVAPSNGLREVLRDLKVSARIEVVPNGVDLKPFQNPETGLKKSDLGFSEDDVLMIYVGRLGAEKNLVLLMRAFAGVAQAYGQVGLVLVGDGPDRDDLENRARIMGVEDKVRFAGFVPYEETPNYLHIADAFTTSSISEVHPLSVIEAMAAGLPVLGIDSPGVGDTIVDGVTGYLSTHDLAAFTAKMVRLVTDHETRRMMGVKARIAADEYRIEKTSLVLLSKYEELLRNLAPRKRGLRQRVSRLIGRRN